VTDDLVKRLNMVDATMNPMTLVIVAREAARYIERLETEVRMTATYDRLMQKLADDQAQRIEQLEAALRVAAGYISTKEGHTDQHPQDVYDWIFRAALGEKKDD
jgi:hypothetical protein